MDYVTRLLGQIAKLIINPLIILGFVTATVVLFYGIVELILKADSGELEEKRRNVMYGVVGLFIMFSVYGILRLAMATFSIPCSGVFFCS